MTKRLDPEALPPLDPERTTRGALRRRAPRTRLPIAITPQMLEGAPDFVPAPTASTRFDGWTYPRQRAFVKALAETCVVARAADAVGMSSEGAYRLKRTPGAEGFAAAWDEALSVVRDTLTDVALNRALHGTVVPIVHGGTLVAERTHYDNRLLGMLMRAHDPDRYGAPGGSAGAVVSEAVRQRLRAEWDEERRREADAARERIKAKLDDMHRRLCVDPDCEECWAYPAKTQISFDFYTRGG